MAAHDPEPSAILALSERLDRLMKMMEEGLASMNRAPPAASATPTLTASPTYATPIATPRGTSSTSMEFVSTNADTLAASTRTFFPAEGATDDAAPLSLSLLPTDADGVPASGAGAGERAGPAAVALPPARTAASGDTTQASTIADRSASPTSSIDAHKMFDEMTYHQEAAAACVIQVTVSHLLYPVTMGVLHQVFGQFDARKVCMLEESPCVEAMVTFRSHQDAVRAQEAYNGRCIWDGCCVMSISVVQPPMLSSSHSLSSMAATPTVEPASSVMTDATTGAAAIAGEELVSALSVSYSTLGFISGSGINHVMAADPLGTSIACCDAFTSKAFISPAISNSSTSMATTDTNILLVEDMSDEMPAPVEEMALDDSTTTPTEAAVVPGTSEEQSFCNMLITVSSTALLSESDIHHVEAPVPLVEATSKYIPVAPIQLSSPRIANDIKVDTPELAKSVAEELVNSGNNDYVKMILCCPQDVFLATQVSTEAWLAKSQKLLTANSDRALSQEHRTDHKVFDRGKHVLELKLWIVVLLPPWPPNPGQIISKLTWSVFFMSYASCCVLEQVVRYIIAHYFWTCQYYAVHKVACSLEKLSSRKMMSLLEYWHCCCTAAAILFSSWASASAVCWEEQEAFHVIWLSWALKQRYTQCLEVLCHYGKDHQIDWAWVLTHELQKDTLEIISHNGNLLVGHGKFLKIGSKQFWDVLFLTTGTCRVEPFKEATAQFKQTLTPIVVSLKIQLVAKQFLPQVTKQLIVSLSAYKVLQDFRIFWSFCWLCLHQQVLGIWQLDPLWQGGADNGMSYVMIWKLCTKIQLGSATLRLWGYLWQQLQDQSSRRVLNMVEGAWSTFEVQVTMILERKQVVGSILRSLRRTCITLQDCNSLQERLEGKPHFKRRGMSRTGLPRGPNGPNGPEDGDQHTKEGKEQRSDPSNRTDSSSTFDSLSKNLPSSPAVPALVP